MKQCRLLVLFFLLVLAGCGSVSQTEPVEQISSSTSDEIQTEQDVQIEVVEEPLYAEDEVVNRFIIDYQNVSGTMISDIKKGNIRTKYFGYLGNGYTEMLNGNDGAFHISYRLKSSNGDLTEEEIIELLTNCLKVFGASDDEIEQTVSAFEGLNRGSYDTNDRITCTLYPTGTNQRMEIVCVSY